MPRSEKIQQMYNEMMSTIIPDSKYHDRWMIDEEIANTIKDGNAIGTYTNLNSFEGIRDQFVFVISVIRGINTEKSIAHRIIYHLILLVIPFHHSDTIQ